MVGAWLVDAAGRPVRRAILWNDVRAQSVIDRLSAEKPDFMGTIFRSSGSAMQQGCTLPVVRWLLDHEPETLERTAAVLCCKDWLRFCLTGDRALDTTEAAVLPGDSRACDLSEAMFDWLDVTSLRDRFPPARASEAWAGDVTPHAAEATGLCTGTPVVTGAGDVPASILGAGAVRPGEACVVLGTTCLTSVAFDHPVFEPPDVGLLFVLPGGGWARVMATVAGTTNLDWFADRFYPAEKAALSGPDLYARLETDAMAASASGLFYLPYLSEAGIIAPVVEPRARAQFSGLSPAHTRADLLRAVYEGVALSVRDCVAAMGAQGALQSVILSGGGARSAFWLQMIADCLNAEVHVPEGAEFGAKGAALLAAVALKWYATPFEAATVTQRIARSYTPTHDAATAWEARFHAWMTLRDAQLPVWPKL
jgi:sugar (pentulose or hexulose) kinase